MGWFIHVVADEAAQGIDPAAQEHSLENFSDRVWPGNLTTRQYIRRRFRQTSYNSLLYCTDVCGPPNGVM